MIIVTRSLLGTEFQIGLAGCELAGSVNEFALVLEASLLAPHVVVLDPLGVHELQQAVPIVRAMTIGGHADTTR